MGRAREIAVLDAAVARLAEGRGGVVWLCGPVGSGRSVLLDHVAATAAAIGAIEVIRADLRHDPTAWERLESALAQHPRRGDPSSESVIGATLALVDDADATAGRLRDVVARSSHRRLLLVAAATGGAPGDTPSLRLGPLTGDDIRTMVRGLLPDAPEGAVETIAVWSGGYPAAAATLAASASEVSERTVPHLLAGHAARVVEGLDADARGAVEAAAVLQRPLDLDVLRLLWHRPIEEVDVLVASLDDAGILTPALRWARPYLPLAVAAALPPGRRRELATRVSSLRTAP